MKRLIFLAVAACLCLSMTACITNEPYIPASDPAYTSGTTGPVQTAPAAEVTSPTADTVSQPTYSADPYPYPLTAVSLPVHEDSRYAEDGKELFRYSYQTMSLITQYPDAAYEITIDFLNQTDFSHSAAQSVDQAAVAAYDGQSDWTPYFYSVEYAPTRIDQAILSLSGRISYYDGAPHSNTVAKGLTYDLVHGSVLSLPQLLVPNYDSAALTDLICRYFPAESSEHFYPDYYDVILDMFSTNIPVEGWYLSTEGLCFFFNPGEIAPYSEEIPVSMIPYSELSGLLQDAYFPAELAEYYGRPVFSQISPEDITDGDIIAELILDQEGSYYRLCCLGTVQNLTIKAGSCNATEFTEQVTLFASQALSVEESVIICATEEQIDQLCISYFSGSQLLQNSPKELIFIYGDHE